MTKQEKYLYDNHHIFWTASKHHRTHKGEMLDFVNYPYQKEIYLDENGKDIMKSTQSGLSEWLSVLDFTLAAAGKQVFHVLPDETLRNRFVKNRFNKSVEYSQYYKTMVKDSAMKAGSDAVSLKIIRHGSIAFVGSNSTAGFTEFPADVYIIDEKNECDQNNIEMAVERISNSDDRRYWNVSNPTILKYGIHINWLESSQTLWHIKADCGHYVQPDPFKHLLRQVDEKEFVIRDENFDWNSGKDINLICDQCGKPVTRRGDGLWIPTFSEKRTGLQINKLFTTKVTLREIVERFDKGLTNDTIMQRVHNADFGLPYTAEGANISETALNRCVNDFFTEEFYTESACVLGADVGTMIHVKISSLTDSGELRTRFIGSVQSEAEFNQFFQRYNIVAGVIDALPETRMSKRLCNKHPGLFRCFYGRGKEDRVSMEEKTVTVDRTSALDNVKESILLRKTLLPKNAKEIPEYYDHMMASTRIYDEKRNEYIWVETGADHLFHASAYELIARNLLIRLAGA